jgi:uncharacterized protein YodC (DUF2158 family)
MTDFQRGDVVQLKSGGPKMTVERIGSSADSNSLLCLWFEDDKLREKWASTNITQEIR